MIGEHGSRARRVRVAAIAAASWLGAVQAFNGCARSRPAGEPIVGTPIVEERGPMTAAAVGARAARRLTYIGGEQGGAPVLEVERGRAGGVITVREGVRSGAAGELAPSRELTLLERDDGSIALAEQVDHAERVLVVFDPPLVVAPGSLEVGGTYTQRLTMTVHPIGDRSRTRAQGPVNQELSYVGDERIRTPAGEWLARRLRGVFVAELGPTLVRNETDQWLVDGVGVVAEERAEHTTLMGMPLRDRRERWVLEGWSEEGAGEGATASETGARPSRL